MPSRARLTRRPPDRLPARKIRAHQFDAAAAEVRRDRRHHRPLRSRPLYAQAADIRASSLPADNSTGTEAACAVGPSAANVFCVPRVRAAASASQPLLQR